MGDKKSIVDVARELSIGHCGDSRCPICNQEVRSALEKKIERQRQALQKRLDEREKAAALKPKLEPLKYIE
jgi:serine/threonine protein phosphatase PrpC